MDDKVTLTDKVLQERREDLRNEFKAGSHYKPELGKTGGDYFYTLRIEKALIEARIQLQIKDLPF